MLQRMGRMGLLAAGVAALSVACGDGGHPVEKGVPTGSVCPTASALTYANFGQAFFAGYCQRCHGSTVTGLARMGAPVDHTFDTAASIRAMTPHIDENAAAGPAATNTAMPPDAPTPTEAERMQLGEWLACGAPE